ncbi:MAG: protoporphyrinogen oxidase [Acidobacteria bacterium]|nr:protoporphyrinogen oxidase [Acidobacteriota bacterium]
MQRIAIIGGGISGLTSAFRLEQQRARGMGLEFVLFESSARFGGVIKTDQVEGSVLETGPDSFLTEKIWAVDLCRELGLADQLIPSCDAQRTTFILVGGRLVAVPDGLMFMVPTRLLPTFFSPLFSWRTKFKIVSEWLLPPPAILADTTVAKFLERHYGTEMVERLVDPLLLGVYGGSAEELSVEAVLPRLVDIERRHGSLGRGLAASKKSAAIGRPKALFTSLKNGMQQIVDALVARIPPQACRLNSPVEAVVCESGRWLVVSSGRTEEFDAAIIAAPAPRAAEMLKANASLAGELGEIRYSSSLTVVLKYEGRVRSAMPSGFGFLVPRQEKRRLLAATFVHNKFAHRAPADQAVLRCFFGGTSDEEIYHTSDDQIEEIVSSEVGQILKLQERPAFLRIQRWEKAMPQYGLGHQERIKRIRALLDALPGLGLAGNAYSGIGVPDCIRNASEAALKVLNDLGLTQPLTQSGP